MSDLTELLQRYEHGVESLRAAFQRFPDEWLDQHPVEGKWSARELLCHLVDAEVVYADRMKRVLAEDNPTIAVLEPSDFVSLVSSQRTPAEELAVMAAIRNHMSAILRAADIEAFQRTGVHSAEGPMTLETLVERITGHIPHHVDFLNEKFDALSAS